VPEQFDFDAAEADVAGEVDDPFKERWVTGISQPGEVQHIVDTFAHVVNHCWKFWEQAKRADKPPNVCFTLENGISLTVQVDEDDGDIYARLQIPNDLKLALLDNLTEEH
jgi:hypothetical protein